MAKEIERKYLVVNNHWKKLAVPLHCVQGNIFIEDGKTLRVRILGNKGYLTIKSKIRGISREEYEYEIPVNDARKLLDDFCKKPWIEKNRYQIPINGMIWEVDEFLGENKGLVIAEIELQNENQPVKIPEWLGKEVSYDHRYYSAYLYKNPYQTWR